MRLSSVAQGSKSWASKLKLHPQLLTNSESAKLLNALTSAFREKLDEAHPRNAVEDPKKQALFSPALKPANAFYSSAAHADKHLESVLTNPLLGGRVLDYGTAQVELTRSPNKDPVELLQEYHEKGAASVAIAELCLRQVRQSIESLPQSQQQSAIQKSDAGRRVFKWLVESILHDSEKYADSLTFLEDLVFFLVKEGHEKDVWSWVLLDIKSNDVPPNATGSSQRIARKTNLYNYRWRGRILRYLLQAKLGPIHKDGAGPGIPQTNSALDTLFKICELNKSATQLTIPMAPISSLFERIFSPPHIIARDVDAVRFEKYIEHLPIICNAPPFLLDLKRARARLVHPSGRQPALALKCFQRLFEDSSSGRHFLEKIREGGNESFIRSWWSFATATIYALRQQGSHEDADWLRARCAEEFPRQEPFFEAKMIDYRRYDMDREARLDQRVAEVSEDRISIPFTTLASTLA